MIWGPCEPAGPLKCRQASPTPDDRQAGDGRGCIRPGSSTQADVHYTAGDLVDPSAPPAHLSAGFSAQHCRMRSATGSGTSSGTGSRNCSLVTK